MLACMAADGASRNFGKYNGALNMMAELVGQEISKSIVQITYWS